MTTITVRGQRFGGVPRDHWRRVNDSLDPDTDFVQIYRNLAVHEFPWDITQALSFALFRTFAVPGIGKLLDETGAFTGATQKRYDDTVLLLEVPFLRGFDDEQGRAAIRRINQMHRSYDIPNHEMLYVLATFVVVPQRWISVWGKRPMTDVEVRASVRYFRTLGKHMGISDMPDSFEGFASLMDDYEAEYFAFDSGARRVADATLALLASFVSPVPKGVVRVVSLALMDAPLRNALGYSHPPLALERLVTAAMRARGRALRLFPARLTQRRNADSQRMRSYSDGFVIAQLGTFPGGCPVRSVDAHATRSGRATPGPYPAGASDR
ncbi:L-aspartate oxidase [Rhodococcus sp. 05-2255-3B1]|uniref:oxygenase MpaB family protein n=1 Tax=unclassified Rhodococcus (in: high G+C Gram-positive bacteria) TaxID=192944 RepID=UPI000B9BD37D|nr:MULTISPECIES: oxygenase MpaB family protein [unclassified Rhodococcus (in: high G+C Gram-positive bacteria)]OZE02515.1 L-aspartate oxidase [Rhodococcus sp. 05-2255-3C]OZE11419.1 L-aspartate oxidase [Rhodococcus sp. 05-2255-3B1]OZE13145.1 L-aspartate oxidase [Rhodococcus sp. 05-2255-2A2]